MLDRYYVNPRPQTITQRTTIEERRAPTDESVRLLREMEAKAEAEVIKSIHVGNTEFECVVQEWRDNASDETCLRAVFNLNGKQMTAEHRHRPRGREINNLVDGFDGLRDEMVKVITEEMLGHAWLALARTRYAG